MCVVGRCSMCKQAWVQEVEKAAAAAAAAGSARGRTLVSAWSGATPDRTRPKGVGSASCRGTAPTWCVTGCLENAGLQPLTRSSWEVKSVVERPMVRTHTQCCQAVLPARGGCRRLLSARCSLQLCCMLCCMLCCIAELINEVGTHHDIHTGLVAVLLEQLHQQQNDLNGVISVATCAGPKAQTLHHSFCGVSTGSRGTSKAATLRPTLSAV